MTRSTPRTHWHVALVALLAIAFVSLSAAQDQSKSTKPDAKAAAKPSPADDAAAKQPAPSADEVRNRLLQQRQANPLIEPSRSPTPSPQPLALPADPRILGVAPGQPVPMLRREGEFVIGRRGRLVRAAGDGGHLFAFDADSADAPEPPMILMPCMMLQNMEQFVQERGDKIVFILSGQVFVYHGANHLLPTMMKLAVDRGNLKN